MGDKFSNSKEEVTAFDCSLRNGSIENEHSKAWGTVGFG